jgi:hypothetical protein
MGSNEELPVEVAHEKSHLPLSGASLLIASDHPDVDDPLVEYQNSDTVVANGRHKDVGASNYDTLHVSPFWNVMHKVVPPWPNPRATATLWAYSQLRPELMKAAEVVSAEEAERRVLILVN